MRTATCACGALRAQCHGEPVRVSVCHCLDCQRRSGSAFAAQVRFPAAAVKLEGEAHEYRRLGEQSVATFRFCPLCGVTIAYSLSSDPEMLAVPLGGFGEAQLPQPAYSVYEERKRPWVNIVGEGIEHFD